MDPLSSSDREHSETILKKGVTGILHVTELLLSEIDKQVLGQVRYALGRAKKLRFVAPTEPYRSSNYYVFEVSAHQGMFYLLLNAHYPILATSTTNLWGPP